MVMGLPVAKQPLESPTSAKPKGRANLGHPKIPAPIALQVEVTSWQEKARRAYPGIKAGAGPDDPEVQGLDL